MFRRKLKALEHDAIESVNIDDEMSFRRLVVWLEDRKIRNYRKEDRELLRNIQSKTWDDIFQKYLDNLVCPITPISDRHAITDWLLGYAVRLEYADGMDRFNKITAAKNGKPEETPEARPAAPQVVSNNPLDKLDFQHPDFINGVNSLADMLKVPHHPDHLVTLKACSRLVQERIASFVANRKAYPVPTGQAYPIQESDLGFDTGDYVLNHAAKILRLLYVHDIRELQTRINEIIVSAQKVTANPKTDTRLGKVGS